MTRRTESRPRFHDKTNMRTIYEQFGVVHRGGSHFDREYEIRKALNILMTIEWR
jgi:hypothetical protein